MKTPLLLTVLAILAFFALPASAQDIVKPVTLYSSGTAVIAASGTLAPSNAVATSNKHVNLGIQASFKLSGTGSGNVVLSFAKSLDGTTFETVPSVTLTIAASGTNTVAGVTNVSLGAVPKLKLVSVTNANTPSTVNELVVKTAIKPGEK